MVSLFDFEVENDVSEEKIAEMFEVFKQVAKQQNNGHVFRKIDMPPSILPYYVHFEQKGWIEDEGDRIRPRRDLLSYHTPEELIEEYSEKMQQLLDREGACWYNDFLPVRNFSGPIGYANNDDRDRFYQLKREVTKQAAIQLGLDHFLNVPSARGMKMNRFDSKFCKKFTVPMIASYVIPMTDYDEVEKFFRSHAFFCGKRDFGAPYPEYRTFMPTELCTAALAEADDLKTVSLIVSYSGGSWVNGDTERYKVLYPEGWSYQKYQESLTDEDIWAIFEDIERLDRLHGGRYLNGRSI